MRKKVFCSLLACCFMVSVSGLSENAHAEEEEFCSENYLFGTINPVASSPMGYYILDYAYLKFLSKENNQLIYLCGNPECKHAEFDKHFYQVTEEELWSCNAYVGTVLPCSVVYEDPYVYVLGYDEMTSDVSLQRISMDGSVHENLGVIGQAPDTGSYYTYVLDDNIMYFSYNEPSMKVKNNHVSVQSFDLESGEIEELYVAEGKNLNIYLVREYDGLICFRESKLDEEGNQTDRLLCYDTEKEEIEEVYSGEFYRYAIEDSDHFYLYVTDEGIYSLDRAEGTKELLWEADESTGFAELAYDGEYLYLSNWYAALIDKEQFPYQITVVDKDGNLVNQIDMDVKGLGDVQIIDRENMVADWYGPEYDQVSWALIPKEKLADPEVEWEPVNSINE